MLQCVFQTQTFDFFPQFNFFNKYNFEWNKAKFSSSKINNFFEDKFEGTDLEKKQRPEPKKVYYQNRTESRTIRLRSLPHQLSKMEKFKKICDKG